MRFPPRISAITSRLLAPLALAVSIVLASCAAGLGPALLMNYGPDMFATMFGQYETRSEFREARPYMVKQDWLGLTVLARQKLEREPTRGEWWQIAGYGHLQMREYREARDCFERTVKLLPEEVGAWNLYAYSLNALGDKRGALAAIEKAIQTDPSSNSAFVVLGELHREAGRVRPSRQAFERALDIDNNDIFAWYGLGLLSKRNNDQATYQKAREALKQLYPSMAEQLEKA